MREGWSDYYTLYREGKDGGEGRWRREERFGRLVCEGRGG